MNLKIEHYEHGFCKSGHTGASIPPTWVTIMKKYIKDNVRERIQNRTVTSVKIFIHQGRSWSDPVVADAKRAGHLAAAAYPAGTSATYALHNGEK